MIEWITALLMVGLIWVAYLLGRWSRDRPQKFRCEFLNNCPYRDISMYPSVVTTPPPMFKPYGSNTIVEHKIPKGKKPKLTPKDFGEILVKNIDEDFKYKKARINAAAHRKVQSEAFKGLTANKIDYESNGAKPIKNFNGRLVQNPTPPSMNKLKRKRK